MTGTTWCKLTESKWEFRQAHSLVEGAFALLLLAPGTVGLAILSTVVMTSGFWSDPLSALLGIAFLLLFCGILSWFGLWFMFGRCGVLVDKNADRVMSWWSLFCLHRTRSVDLRSYDTVELEAHPGKGGPRAYKVLLTAAKSWTVVRIVREGDEATARNLALELAQFLGFDCETGRSALDKRR